MLGGRYKLLDELGNGGMAVVWRARDEVLGRSVAVKLLAGRYANDPQSRARIRDEARAAATLSHPNIAQVYDFGESDEGGVCLPYVVMELINGPTLQQQVALGPLPPGTAFRICSQVAGALAAAHADGLVHRDIKPANVMVTPAGAKVVDFGIAAAAGPVGPDEVLLGTPAYLAPERLTGGDVTPASDVYALGVLLYRLLANESPWAVDTTTQMLTAHVYVEPAPLPQVAGVPLEVSEMVDRCLRKDPAERPSAAQASAILAAAADRAAARRLAEASRGLAEASRGLAGAAPGAGLAPGTGSAHGAGAAFGFGEGAVRSGGTAHGLGEGAIRTGDAPRGPAEAPRSGQLRIFGADTTDAVRAGVAAGTAFPLRRATGTGTEQAAAASGTAGKPAATGTSRPGGNAGEKGPGAAGKGPDAALGVPAGLGRKRKRRALAIGGGIAAAVVAALIVWSLMPSDSGRRSDVVAGLPAAPAGSAAAVDEPGNPGGLAARQSPGGGVKGLPPIAAGTHATTRSRGVRSPTNRPSPGNPSPGKSTAPGGGPVVTTTDAPPATTRPPKRTTTLSSVAGTVEARCTDVATATLVSWKPTAPYRVNRVSPGPAVAAEIVFKDGLSRIRMTVTCVAGNPTAVTLPL